MLSLSSSQIEPSALLSNARLTIATLIQRPSTITTSNAFDEFSILDNLIDVSNDVDRCEDGENRKFLNIAQLITASTCIYSRRVDALYKLINTFQSSPSSLTENQSETEEEQPELILNPEQEEEENRLKKSVHEKKKKIKDTNRSFICNDITKINLNPSKNFFLDRTSLYDLKLFQKYVPMENKQFWINDYRPMIFDLLFDQDQIFEINEDYHYEQQQPEPLIDDNDIPLPIPINDDQDSSWNNEVIVNPERFFEKKRSNKSRTKKVKHDIDLNIFRHGLTDSQQSLFRFHKMKPLSTKIKIESTKFFIKKFNQKHFDALIQSDYPLSIFIYPIITIHHLTIRERYSYQSIRSPSIPISQVLDEHALIPLPSFTNDDNDNDDNLQEDGDIRLQTDMEQILDAAIYQSNEEQQHNKIFLELRSSIMSYMTKNNSVKTTNVDDIIESLDNNNNYSLPLVFSQLLHLCASTQRYNLHSTSNDNLFIEKII